MQRGTRLPGEPGQQENPIHDGYLFVAMHAQAADEPELFLMSRWIRPETFIIMRHWA